MALNDKNKLNRLEELKGKLFSKNYQTHIEHRENFSHTGHNNLPDSWNDADMGKGSGAGNFFTKTSMFKKLFIFSLAFFALSMAYAVFVFFAGSNTVSNDNIDITVLGNNFTAGGEDLDLVIGITNRNSSSLDLVDLVVEYPTGSMAGASSDTERMRQSLGTIPAGAVRNENLKLVLFGEQGAVRPIRITLEYRVAGSNSIFVKEKIYNVTINSTPVNISIDAPSSVSPNQALALEIKTSLNATRPAEKMLLRVDYPVGFQFAEAVPAPTYGDNIWSLGDLPPGAEHTVRISGKMIDVFDGEEKTFNVESGSQSPSNKSVIGVVFNSARHTVAVSRPFIEADLSINGVKENAYAVDAKTPLNVEIKYSNNMDVRVDDLKIKAKLSGNAFNRNTVRVQQGYYDSATDTIIWDKSTTNGLRQVDPGESDAVSFSVSPLSLYAPGATLLSSPEINIAVDMEASPSVQGGDSPKLENSAGATVRIISDVGFTNKALYYGAPFPNSGPIPPKVGQETTYAIVWSLTNTANSISKAEVVSSLPAWIKFEGSISPAGENLTYNATTREIKWVADRIQRGAGLGATPSRTVAFKVSINPSLSHAGTSPTLINEAVLTGHDDFANVDIRVNKGSLSTRLESDPGVPLNGGIVVP